jgi:hypothetical protein
VAADKRETFVVRCTFNRRKHPRLYAALADEKASERPERVRHYAAIGLALATNQPVLELIGIAVGEVAATNARKASESRSDEATRPTVAKEHPGDDYLDQLAGAVLNRA